MTSDKKSSEFKDLLIVQGGRGRGSFDLHHVTTPLIILLQGLVILYGFCCSSDATVGSQVLPGGLAVGLVPPLHKVL